MIETCAEFPIGPTSNRLKGSTDLPMPCLRLPGWSIDLDQELAASDVDALAPVLEVARHDGLDRRPELHRRARGRSLVVTGGRDRQGTTLSFSWSRHGSRGGCRPPGQGLDRGRR